MKHYTARETEYKGVAYASKSEAIFARSLDLLKKDNINRMSIDFLYTGKNSLLMNRYNYSPDFIVSYICDYCKQLSIHAIEYKPSIPTKTYLKELSGRVMNFSEFLFPYGEKIADSINMPSDKNIEFMFFVVYGSPYNNGEIVTLNFCGHIECKCFHECPKDGFNYSFMRSLFDRSRDYRFDLDNDINDTQSIDDTSNNSVVMLNNCIDTAITPLSYLLNLGFRVQIKGENLAVSSSSKLTEDQRSFIKSNKSNILDELHRKNVMHKASEDEIRLHAV